MTIQIRPYTPDDAPAIVQISNEINPENLMSVTTFEARERQRRPDLLFERRVVEQDGEVIGSASFGQLEWFDNPRSLHFNVNIQPARQGQGLGRMVYEWMLTELARTAPSA